MKFYSMEGRGSGSLFRISWVLERGILGFGMSFDLWKQLGIIPLVLHLVSHGSQKPP